jgi:membrane-associated protease RseP (regulator of RpoE activity)
MRRHDVLVFLLVALAASIFAVLGRWAGSAVFGSRSLREAIVPWSKGTGRCRAARAAGGIAGWYIGVVVVAILGVSMAGVVTIDEKSMRVNVAHDGPAERAGIRKGDRIVGVEDQRIGDWDQLRRVIGQRKGEATRVTFERDAVQSVAVTTPTAEGKILVGPYTETRSAGVGEALGIGLSLPFEVVSTAFRGFAHFFRGQRVEMSSAVAVVTEANKQSSFGTALKFGAALASYIWPLVILVNIGLAFVQAYSGRRAHA